MAGNTRGRLKERFEGIHRNFEWAKTHCAEALILVGGKNKKLTEGIEQLDTMIDTMDELAQNIYAKI